MLNCKNITILFSLTGVVPVMDGDSVMADGLGVDGYFV